MIRALVFGLALLFWAAPAFAAPGFAYNERCYPTKLEAAQAMCRLGFPTLDQGNLSSDTRTVNRLRYSEELDNSAWAAVSNLVSVTANSAISPTGSNDADVLSIGANGYTYQRYQAGSAIAGSTWTFSVWLSSPTKASIALRMANDSNGSDQAFSQVQLTATPTRYSVTRSFTESGNSMSVGFDNRYASLNVAGDVVVWGAQLENTQGATSYSRTGASSQAEMPVSLVDGWQRVTWCTGASSGDQLELSWTRPPATTQVVNTTLRVDFPACDTEHIEDGLEFYSIAGLGVLLFFSLMHGFSVGRVMV